jgi:hypothetical protein
MFDDDDKPPTGGWIKVHRKTWSDPIFGKGRYSYREAFLYLVSTARFTAGAVGFRGNIYKLKRGQLITTKPWLASKWHWHRNTVRKTLNLWQDAGMISMRGSYGHTIISILNYNKYQSSSED